MGAGDENARGTPLRCSSILAALQNRADGSLQAQPRIDVPGPHLGTSALVRYVTLALVCAEKIVEIFSSTPTDDKRTTKKKRQLTGLQSYYGSPVIVTDHFLVLVKVFNDYCYF